MDAMPFEWNEGLAVGVQAIDRQHQELIAHINSLLNAMKQGQGRQEIGRLLRFVEDYVGVHFSAEEKLMVQHQYPDYPAHKAQHTGFVRDFCRLKDEVESAPLSSVPLMHIQRRVCDWLINHIGKTDRCLGEFLKTG
jgi:hemerythrin